VPSDAAERKTVTQKCFDANRLLNAKDGTPYWWFGKKPAGEYTMDFRLPPGISCARCVLQWHYESGNSCTIPGTPEQHVMSPNMVPCDQTGVMEEFWNCADVSVSDRGSSPAPGVKPIKKPAKTANQVAQPGQEAYQQSFHGSFRSFRDDERFYAALVSLATIAAVAALPVSLAVASTVAALGFVLTQRAAAPPQAVWPAVPAASPAAAASRRKGPTLALPAPQPTVGEWTWRRPARSWSAVFAKRVENIFRGNE
jgi:hypothetical protein